MRNKAQIIWCYRRKVLTLPHINKENYANARISIGFRNLLRWKLSRSIEHECQQGISDATINKYLKRLHDTML